MVHICIFLGRVNFLNNLDLVRKKQYLAAYCLRSEIFLFLLPFLLLLILVRYYRNSGFSVNKGELKRWGVVCAGLVCGVAAVSLVNRESSAAV